MLGHPLDLLLAHAAASASNLAPRLGQPLDALILGDRLPAATALRAAAAPGTDPDQRALALAFARTATHLALLCLPDGGGRQMIQLQGQLPLLVADDEPLQAAAAAAHGPARAIVDLLVKATRLLQWQAMLPPHAAYSPQFTPEILQQARTGAAALTQLAGPVGVGLQVLGQAWLADVLRRAGQREEAAVLWAAARAASDPVLLPHLDLLRGDWHAAPLSSPLAWNSALQPAVGVDGTLGGLEALEGRVGVDVAAAEERYARAEAASGGDPGLAAALQLRRGWLDVVRGDFGSALTRAQDAHDRYAAHGHHLGAAVAAVHTGLAALAAGRLPGRVDRAETAGAWLVGHAGPGCALGLGQVCSRVSWRWRTEAGALEPALAALDLSEAVVRPLGVAEHLTRCDIDRAQVRSAAGDTRGARLLLRQSLDRLASGESEAAVSSRPLEESLILLQLYQLGLAERDAAAMRFASERLRSVRLPPGVDIPGPPAPDQDALAVAYEAQRLEADGQREASAAGYAQAMTLAQAGQPMAAATVLAARHEFAAAAALVEEMNSQLMAALDRGELGFDLGLVPAALVVPMLDLQRRRLAYQAFAAAVRLRDPRAAAGWLARLSGGRRDPWWFGVGEEREACLYLALLREQQADLEAADAAYRQGLAAAGLRRAALSRDELKAAAGGDLVTADLHRGACRVGLLRGDRAGAFELAGRGQARALLDLLAANVTARDASPAAASRLPPDAVTRWRGAGAELERAGRQLLHALASDADAATVTRLRTEHAAADVAANAAAATLAELDPDYWRRVNPSAAPATLDQVRQALAPGQVLLQLLVDAGDVLAWAVTRDGVAASHLAVGQWELAGAASRFRRACAAGEEAVADAELLAGSLLLPLAESLRDAARVVVVASGPTAGLAFHALPFEGEPFGRHRVVSYLPTAGLLPLLAGGGPVTLRGALVVGDPAAMSLPAALGAGPGGVEPLPGARVEARYVARLLPESRCLIGAEAREDAVRALLASAPVAHLATHGYVDRDAPQGSCVLLADGASLDVAELTGMRLAADLVVLSACHTAGGEPAGGDELMGLARSLLAAGARTVVVTLWDVDDVSAALVMGRFYEDLTAGADPPTALAQAQRWLAGLDPPARDAAYQRLRTDLADTDADPARAGTRRVRPDRPVAAVGCAHPRHWAPFIVIGA